MGGRKVLSVCGGWQPGIPHPVKTSHVNTHPLQAQEFQHRGEENTNNNKKNTDSRRLGIPALSKPKTVNSVENQWDKKEGPCIYKHTQHQIYIRY